MNRPMPPEDEAALDESLETVQPIDTAVAADILREAKRILDDQGITFALVSGTCLGAVRDNALMPWDDDIDLGSVLGRNGLTEEKIERVVTAFRDAGFIARMAPVDDRISVPLLKESIRIDWIVFRIIDDSTFHYPGIRIPAGMLTDLTEMDFIGERFNVPNPPEEYLRLKYGADWTVAKRAGEFEADVGGPDTRTPRAGTHRKAEAVHNQAPSAVAGHRDQGP
ncbi:MAG: LicD family protein [Dehalococcoidales bacterium]